MSTMGFSLAQQLVVLAMLCLATTAVEKKIPDSITICKLNDPELATCLWTNMNNTIPRLPYGLPEMNIMPIDPVVVENVKFEFLQTESVRLSAILKNLTIVGLRGVQVSTLEAHATSDGVQAFLGLRYPEIDLKSLYNAVGKFLLIEFNTTSHFHAELTEIKVSTVWNSTIYVKDNKDYLRYKGKIIDMTIGKAVVHFNDIFGNNSNLNENINHVLNENINLLYDEFKFVIWNTIIGRLSKLAENFYETFPLDVLYIRE